MTKDRRSARLLAEGLGTALLLAAVVGSGIMGERLAGGNVAVALLANTIATGAMLIVLISMLGPISGAHFNPAVSLVFAIGGDLPRRDLAPYVAAQVAGAVIGVWTAHMMFDEAVFQWSSKVRSGPAQWLSEFVAAFGLMATILLTLKAQADRVATNVGLYIVSAYWFTASTSFANPAVTLARSLSDTFAGIRPEDVAAFAVAQIAGMLAARPAVRWLVAKEPLQPQERAAREER